MQIVVGDDAQDVHLDEVVIDHIAGRNGDISIGHPAVVVDIFLADLLLHLLLRNPKMRQQLEAVILMEKQHVSRNVRHIREVQSSPAGAAFQVGRCGHADTFHPCLVENPCALGIDPQVHVLRHDIADSLRAVFGVLDLVSEIVRRE